MAFSLPMLAYLVCLAKNKHGFRGRGGRGKAEWICLLWLFAPFVRSFRMFWRHAERERGKGERKKKYSVLSRKYFAHLLLFSSSLYFSSAWLPREIPLPEKSMPNRESKNFFFFLKKSLLALFSQQTKGGKKKTCSFLSW